MSDTSAVASKTPWHLWVVGIVALLWNGFGGYDYVMTNMGGAEYLRAHEFTAPEIDYFLSYPAWMTAVWAIGVWGGVAGAILLLLRSKWALHAFAASLAAFVLSLVYTYALSDGGTVVRAQFMYMNIFILALCVFFAWYAWFATKRGLLR
jgi:hypothetical protein